VASGPFRASAGGVQRNIGVQQLAVAENEEASQRVVFLAEVPGLLRELGVDPAEVLASVGLDPDSLDRAENRIAFAAASRLLHACVIRTGCQHFALIVGQRMRLSQLGLAGQLAFYSSTLRAAIRAFAVYQHLNSEGMATFLLEEDGVAVLGPLVCQSGVEHVEQLYDVAIAATLSFIRQLSGARWRPERVLFSHSKPTDGTVYRRSFQAPCRFDVERTALMFPASMLDHELASADPKKLRILEAQARQRDDWDLSLRLRRALRTLLLTQRVSAEQVASLVSMHRRTLNRRLKVEGTTFQALLDEVRFEAACQLLDATRIPITEIAMSLGYSETSAFSRAFRRWSGSTPAERRPRFQRSPRDLPALPRGARSAAHDQPGEALFRVNSKNRATR
jgi:AraC-like DNA-binding protein